MVALQEKGTKKPSRNIFLRGAAYDTTRKLTVIPIQETKKEDTEMKIQKKVILVNDVINMTTGNNPDPTSGIYLTAVKVSQFRMVAESRRENKSKKGNRKEDSHPQGLY